MECTYRSCCDRANTQVVTFFESPEHEIVLYRRWRRVIHLSHLLERQVHINVLLHLHSILIYKFQPRTITILIDFPIKHSERQASQRLNSDEMLVAYTIEWEADCKLSRQSDKIIMSTKRNASIDAVVVVIVIVGDNAEAIVLCHGCT